MLVAVRASHEHLELGVLDALTRSAEEIPTALQAHSDVIRGAVVVSTCNRLELYLDAPRFHDAVDAAVAAIATTSGMDPDDITAHVEADMGRPVAEHLYEVTAGLRSMVVGESEISGQVRTAFSAALDAGRTTPMLNDLFQIGMQHAKRVSSTTQLGASGRSGGAVALDRAADALPMPLEQARVLVIGTGSYARVITAELTRRGALDIHVHSGSGRAGDFARTHAIRAVAADGFFATAQEADLIVAASGQGGGVLRGEHLHGRGDRPLVILDLALQSDLAPDVRADPNAHVIGLADLADDIDDADQIRAARTILTAGVDRFTERQQIRTVDPAITYLRGTVAGAVDDEIARIRERYDDAIAEDFERHLRRIAAKVLHPPTVRARELARTGNAEQYVAAFHTLFGVDTTAPLARADAAAASPRADVAGASARAADPPMSTDRR